MSSRGMQAFDEFEAALKCGSPYAVAIVLGPHHGSEKMARTLKAMGRGWSAAHALWRTSQFRYVVAAAVTPERVKCGAPLVFAAADHDALALAIRETCQHLDDIKCLWVVTVDGPAERLIAEIRLADSVVEGEA